MTVLLTILKMFGWVLLVFLILVTLCVVLVLFVPIRYRILGKKSNEFTLDARFSWLLHLVRVFVSTEEDTLAAEFCILFFRKRIYPSEIEQMEDRFADLEDRVEEAEEAEVAEVAEEADSQEECSPEQECRKAGQSFFVRIQGMFRRISGKLKDSKQFGKRWKKMLADEKNRQAAAHLKREFSFLLKALSPDRMKLTAAFSTGSPDTTGQLLGVIALFPAAYQNRWQISPDFMADKAYVTFDADIKGHFFLICAAVTGLRILFDSNCRRLFALLRR